jgi:hypothetical protein
MIATIMMKLTHPQRKWRCHQLYPVAPPMENLLATVQFALNRLNQTITWIYSKINWMCENNIMKGKIKSLVGSLTTYYHAIIRLEGVNFYFLKLSSSIMESPE